MKLKEENEKLKNLGNLINLIYYLLFYLVKTKKNVSIHDSLIDQDVNLYTNIIQNDSKTARKSLQIRNIDKFVGNIDSKGSQQLHTSVFSSDKILTKSKRVRNLLFT